MKQELNAYIPAIDFTNEKALTPLRTHREDIAVIDPNNHYQILACRPHQANAGASLPSLWAIPDEELSFLRTALSSHSRVALLADGCAVLILGELLAASGVLLAVRPQISPAALRRYAESCGLGDLAFSPAFPRPSASLSEAELEQLDELNYYLGQILTPRKKVGIATLTWRIANFVGCRLEENKLSPVEDRLAEGQLKRLTAYLLCTFLHLRTLGGHTAASGASPAEAPQFRYHVEYVDPSTDDDGKSLLLLADQPFHKLPAFSDFIIRKEGEKLILDAHLPLSSEKKGFRAAIPSLFVLRVTLERI